MKLDCKYPVGNGIKKPEMAGSMSSPSPMSVSYSSPMGDMSSGPNLSKKFKYPSVSQDVPMEGKGQYE